MNAFFNKNALILSDFSLRKKKAFDMIYICVFSKGHDSSIRLWNMDNKTCIQEITAHRKKFDEAVFDVAFHPSQPYIASGGADALAKVFV